VKELRLELTAYEFYIVIKNRFKELEEFEEIHKFVPCSSLAEITSSLLTAVHSLNKFIQQELATEIKS
jgi:hypothetical protein